MDQWASLYANLSKTAPALAAATPSSPSPSPSSSSSSRYSPHVRHCADPLDRRRSRQALEAQARLPAVLAEESDPEDRAQLSEEDEDEVEIEEDELYEVLQGAKKDERRRSRKYANSTFLTPPAPYLHRSLNPEGFAERQRLRRYESYSGRPRSTSPSESVPERHPPPRSSSLPAVPLAARHREDTSSESSLPLSKPRKARPSPLELVPHLWRPYSPESNPPSTTSTPSVMFSASKSPYPTSILALYSPSLPTSPVRTLSLPPFTFSSTDFPSPSGRVRVSSPFPMSMSTPLGSIGTPPMQSQTASKSSSPRTSVASSASSRTSMSSVRHQEMSEINYTLPTPPLPSATFLAKKERIHYTLSPNELPRRI